MTTEATTGPAAQGAAQILRPYGDTTGDGMVQLSFTLPMANSKVAEGAAAQLANKMGMDPALVVHAKAMGPDFTFFVVYGRVNHLVDTSKVQVVERDYPLLIVGGPRFDETMAGELGVDRVFARGTTPGEVASYVVDQLVTKRRGRAATGSAASTTEERAS